MIKAKLIVLFSIGFMFYISWQLSLVAFAGITVLGIYSLCLEKRRERVKQQRKKVIEEMNQVTSAKQYMMLSK